MQIRERILLLLLKTVMSYEYTLVEEGKTIMNQYPHLDKQIYLYSLQNYGYQKKKAMYEKDASIQARWTRLKDEFSKNGIRQSVEAVLLVHQYRMPHVMLLQLGSAYYKLPGDELGLKEDKIDGMTRVLSQLFGELNCNWRIGEIIANWWRPNFDNQLYPYLPSHVTKPKEKKTIFYVSLPEHATFQLPRNYKLTAVPLFQLYENSKVYGPVISSIPHNLCRFDYIYA